LGKQSGKLSSGISGSFRRNTHILIILSGCASTTGKILAVKSPEDFSQISSINIQEKASNIPVSEDVKTYFSEKLKQKLYEEEGYLEGKDITIEYRFVQVNKGNRFIRWLIGFGTGKGAIRIEAKFKNTAGDVTSNIQAEGTISGGILGGEFYSAIDKAVSEMIKYIKQYYSKSQ
jgi:ribosome-associated translation inhibitor RaiA